MKPWSKFLLRTIAAATVAGKRLLSQPLLSLAALIGLTIASGFVLSVPLYADGTYFRLFREEILAGREAELATRPPDYAPLTFVFELSAAGRDSPQWEKSLPADRYLSREALDTLGLPVLQQVRRFRTDGYNFYPPEDWNPNGPRYALTSAYLATITPWEGTIELVAGQYPQPATAVTGGYAVQALASEEMAITFGVQIGERFFLRNDQVEIPLDIVGLWRPLDPNAPYWEPQKSAWLLVHPESYGHLISSLVNDELRNCRWVIVADGAHVHSGDVAALTRRINSISQRVAALLPNTHLILSPLEALQRYQKNAPFLTYLLYAFSVPILGLILAFISLVAELFVGQQRSEMAILRSRGASAAQVVAMTVLQGVLLGLLALTGGIFLGRWIAQATGQARSFLAFGAGSGLRVEMTPAAIGYGLLGMGVLLFIQVLLPSLNAASQTIITYRQERARLLRAPGWQRYGIDMLLLLLAGYGFWVLNLQSRRALSGAAGVPDPLKNPLLLLVPAIGILAAALFTLRLVPRLMALLAWLLRRTKSVGMLMAARYLARSPAFYSAPLVLLILTLGLSAFTASLARTLDAHLEKQMYYQVGADLRVRELGNTFVGDATDAVYTFGPVEEHLMLDGVRAATRVGRYHAATVTAHGVTEGTFLGIDRTTFPLVAAWQERFAPQPLGALMNALAAAPDGVLVSSEFLRTGDFQIGDHLQLSIQPGRRSQSVVMDLLIVGTFDLFPTWYPEQGTLFVGNLDEFFLQAGAEYPHEVWLDLTPNADPQAIVYAIRGHTIALDPKADQSRLVPDGLNIFVEDWASAELNIGAVQRRPERQGLFGLLSAGFVAAAILTTVGFLLYALFSFRRRFIEMGILRAIGLSRQQLTRLLASELSFLVFLGGGVGTGVGLLASRLFVPFLQIGATAQAQYPPFQIEIAWLSIFQMYALFLILFLMALTALVTLLQRMRIFQAIKLGETA